jgi:hypothetical protein
VEDSRGHEKESTGSPLVRLVVALGQWLLVVVVVDDAEMGCKRRET